MSWPAVPSARTVSSIAIASGALIPNSLSVAPRPDDAGAMNDAMQSAKVPLRLLDDSLHGPRVRHVRVQVQDLAPQPFDPPDGVDASPGGIVGGVTLDPLVP